MQRSVCFLCFAALVVQSELVHAGGPLRFSSSGPVVWDTSQPIKYKVDQGDLGSIPAADARALVDAAFKVWTDVSTAQITFASDGLLPSDIATAIDYLELEEDDSGPNVVVFDTDGAIIAALAGEENRFRILGWANPVTTANNSRIKRFYSLMNGLFAVNSATFLSTLVHEFGHAIGMDHTQIHAAFAGNGISSDDAFIPTMFPTSADDDTHLGTLNPDDKAWISLMYKAPTFDANYGVIKGRLRKGTSAVLGANVVAFQEAEDNDQTLSFSKRFSCVSDWLATNNGEFIIPVEPGKYRIFIEPILPDFTSGSSVGAWADSPDSPSFVNPVSLKQFPVSIEVAVGEVENVGDLTAD